MTFESKFLRWLTRNWEPTAIFDADEMVELQEQWRDEGCG